MNHPGRREPRISDAFGASKSVLLFLEEDRHGNGL